MIGKIGSALISPLGSGLVLGCAALMLAFIGRHRAAISIGGFAMVWLWVFSTPVISDWLRYSIERSYPPIPVAQLPKAQAIVVLGGAIAPPTEGWALPDLSGAADRVWHAARLFKAGKAQIVVLSGGSDPAVSTSSEAEAMRVFIGALGVPDAAVLLEIHSRNTRENARFTAALLRRRGIHEILLVTSALHMARACAHFGAQGLTVHPVAIDYEVVSSPSDLRWLPSAAALDISGRAIKEWVGQIIWARQVP